MFCASASLTLCYSNYCTPPAAQRPQTTRNCGLPSRCNQDPRSSGDVTRRRSVANHRRFGTKYQRALRTIPEQRRSLTKTKADFWGSWSLCCWQKGHRDEDDFGSSCTKMAFGSEELNATTEGPLRPTMSDVCQSVMKCEWKSSL